VRQEDMYQMRFPARHFDTVTIDQVLYFASNPDALIKEATRVLKPHGRLLLVAFTEALQAKAPPSVGFAISDIRHWLEEAGLTITATNVLPGDVLDISLLVSEKNKDRS
jgi:ubiquinone/menaquinone biosynthesis C-methylase UbiE